jgi:hypothetical protein
MEGTTAVTIPQGVPGSDLPLESLEIHSKYEYDEIILYIFHP